jgi:hypothetical protein
LPSTRAVHRRIDRPLGRLAPDLANVDERRLTAVPGKRAVAHEPGSLQSPTNTGATVTTVIDVPVRNCV